MKNNVNNSIGLIVIFLSILFLLNSKNSSAKNGQLDKHSFTIEQIVQGYLVPMYITYLVYNIVTERYKFERWFRKLITVSEVGYAAKKRVASFITDQRLSYGGFAMDINNDGYDEIIIARSYMYNLASTSHFGSNEVSGKEYCKELEIACIWQEWIYYTRHKDFKKNC